MQAKLAELETLLEGFVERELGGALVIGCTDVEALYVGKLLMGLDERSEADLFLSFVAPAPTAAQFVSAVVDNFAAQQGALDEAMRAEGKVPPPLPARVLDTEAPPLLRMRGLIEHALTLLPPGDHRLVWSLLPIEVADRAGVTALGTALIEGPHADALRLVLRDDRDAPGAYRVAEAWPDERVLAYPLEMTSDDLAAAAADAAQDPKRPTDERMSALLQLAFLDLGHKRLDAAEAKFSGLARYHEATGERPLQALSTSGVGDVQRARGDLPAARKSYEAALLQVADTQALPVTLQICVSLADTCLALKQYADAEGYYQLADRVASKLLNAYTKADVRESLGVCRLAQRAPRDALQIWNEVAALCRDIDYPKRLASVLGRLAELHGGALPDRKLQDACLKEQDEVRARLAAEGHP